MPISRTIVIRTEPYDYQLDVYHIDRWMCSQCGFILDYQFDDEHPGWPEYEPSPGTIVAQWEDETGEVHPEYVDPKEVVPYCPRCGLNILAHPLIPITVRPLQNITDIAELISQGEGLRLEFKRDRPHPDSIGKTISAFANVEGGKIIFGVDDQGVIVGLLEIATIEGKDNFLKWIRDIAANIQPRVDIQIDFFSEGNIYLATVTIPRGKSAHMYKHIYYVRQLTSSDHASHDQVEKLFEERKNKR